MTKKIMILEDDEATAELIKFYMEEDGYQATISLTGKDFLEKVVEYRPDLITIDILLPHKNGFDIFKELQRDERMRNIPVIFITAVEIEKVRSSGLVRSGYIAKPFREGDLKRAIKAVLQGG